MRARWSQSCRISVKGNEVARYKMIALSAGTPGREDDFQAWYRGQHVNDVLRIPGVVSAQRYSISHGMGNAPWRLMAEYEVDTDDPAKTLADLQARLGGPDMPLTDALDMATIALFFTSADGPLVKA